jgi:hypothetical protein
MKIKFYLWSRFTRKSELCSAQARNSRTRTFSNSGRQRDTWSYITVLAETILIGPKIQESLPKTRLDPSMQGRRAVLAAGLRALGVAGGWDSSEVVVIGFCRLYQELHNRK